MNIIPITKQYLASINLLTLSTCKGNEVVDLNTIVRIEAISNYSKIFFTNKKKLVVAKVLFWFEEKLIYQNFIRTHRTHLVNKSYIQHYFGNGKLQLQNGECINVSRRKRRDVKKYLLANAS